MVDEKRNNLQSIAGQIRDLENKADYGNTERKEQSIKKDVVLFFSFDVVNSTAYKTANYYGWAHELNQIFRKLREDVLQEIEGSEMWRVLGDEEIFIVKVRDENELRRYVNKVFGIMVSTISELKEQKNDLSLKAAAWIAVVEDIGYIDDGNSTKNCCDNIFERYKSKEGYEIFEFLGNDIDTGFRVASQTQDGRLALSFELAYLISQRTDTLSYLHIITYRRLKGVWKNKLYPIIWYHDPKTYLEKYQKEIAFEDSFTFDACDENELVKEYYAHKEQPPKEDIIRDSRMYSDPFYALSKILQDRRLATKMNRLQDAIANATHDYTKLIKTEYMQVHCVAICFSIDEKGEIKILVAQRKNTRPQFGGKWEFGCAKAVIDQSIEQRIKEEYKQDFGIEIIPVLDKNRNMQEPIPIALYHITHGFAASSDKMDKGIITLAQIEGNFDVESFRATSKHERVAWIQKTDLEDISVKYENTIPDFENSLRAAFFKIEELRKKGEI